MDDHGGAVRAQHLAGFGNFVQTEALPGALPEGRNSPQRPPYGLYAEQLSGTAFTAPRGEVARTWLYRLRPSADHPAWRPHAGAPRLATAPLVDAAPNPNRLRWSPLAAPDAPTDFVEGLVTYCAAGDPGEFRGLAAHLYAANADMDGRAFSSSDGELLIVPQEGRLSIQTELGRLEVRPGWAGVIPRGVRFRVRLPDGPSRGYVCENYGPRLRLPELGPIGSNGLANPRDFLTPEAAYEDLAEPCRCVLKFGGRLFETSLGHSPFDVVAWHGNYAPYLYDLSRFNAIGTVSFDHPDPSIFTVLTSPSEAPGVANCDFVIFPPRWMVAEDTFRPPWFHRNVMSEFMGLIFGIYDAKADGFAPGGASLHPSFSAHGPDAATHAQASRAELRPHKIENTLAFMFESRLPLRPTAAALALPELQGDYDACWSGFPASDLSRR